jgi:murein DD-endopeptidase MepM/ murein hydrolase activator NlpD
LKLRFLALALASAAALAGSIPAQAVTRTTRTAYPPVRYYIPPPDYRAPIASRLAVDGQYARQVRDQLDPVLSANAAESNRVLTELTDIGTARNQATAIATAQAELGALGSIGNRLHARRADLDALAAMAAQQLRDLYNRPVADGAADADRLDRDLAAAATDGIWAAYDQARQALADRGISTSAPRLSWPEQSFEISQGYGPTDFEGEPPYQGYDRFHMGVDLAAPMDTPVLAPADGVVVMTGAEGSLGRYFGYGNHVVIAHGGTLDTIYGHLDQVGVRPGDTVRRGQQIGLEGSTGYSTGPHLHFEVHAGGQPVDPGTYLGPR